MEAEDLKNSWAAYDKKLKYHLKLNEEILFKLNQEKSKREMQGTTVLELISVVIYGIAVMLMIAIAIKYSGELKYLISGAITTLLCLAALIYSIQKLKLLTNIDYYNTDVLSLQKKLSLFNRKYLQYKKGEILLFPLLAVAAMPILFKAIHNYDIMNDLTRYIITLMGALGIGYPILFWIYKNWYEKKIKNTNHFLKELEKFEKEDTL